MNNIHPYQLKINHDERAASLKQKPQLVWFTGLSGSGKSTLANAVDLLLHKDGFHSFILDGDNIRSGLNKDLDFTDEDRVENIRRIAEVSKLMLDAGLVVLTAFISPFRSERQMVGELVGQHRMTEVFVDCPLEVCEQRDVKGLYKKAKSGQIPNFTGIDSPYEPPLNADITVQTAELSLERSADKVYEIIKEKLKK